MVCINLQKAFDIINRKILLKKKIFCWVFSLLICLVSWFESYLSIPIFKWVSKVNSPILQTSTGEYHKDLQGFPYWDNRLTSQKFDYFQHLEKFPPVDSPPHQIFIAPSPTKG